MIKKWNENDKPISELNPLVEFTGEENVALQIGEENYKGKVSDLIEKVKPKGSYDRSLFEKMGARLNSDGKTWTFNTLKDLTDEDMLYVYLNTISQASNEELDNYVYGTQSIGTRCRTNYRLWNRNVPCSANVSVCSAVSTIEVFTFSTNVDDVDLPPKNIIHKIKGSSFKNCQNLRKILGGACMTTYEAQSDFLTGVPMLETVYISLLRYDLNIGECANIDKRSIVWMIKECSEDKTFTITLHPDVLAKTQGEWKSEIDAAIAAAKAKRTTITLTA